MDEKSINGAPKSQRKMKFTPKAPKKDRKLVLPKAEKLEEVEADDVKAQELMKRFTEASNKPKFKAEIETKPSQKRVSSLSFGPSVPKAEGGDVGTSSIGTKEYMEPWDYYKYYPTTLPMRRPYSGNPELLDEQEFKEELETNAYNESSTKPTDELGLMKEDLEKKLIFIQLPQTFPLPKQTFKTEGVSGPASTSKPPLKDAGSSSTKACNFNELPTGFMGKMLVYKSGAVKLKLGDHLYDVSGAVDCSFAQDVVAINTEQKHCCDIGEVNKRAVITPDFVSVLDNMKNL